MKHLLLGSFSCLLMAACSPSTVPTSACVDGVCDEPVEPAEPLSYGESVFACGEVIAETILAGDAGDDDFAEELAQALLAATECIEALSDELVVELDAEAEAAGIELESATQDVFDSYRIRSLCARLDDAAGQDDELEFQVENCEFVWEANLADAVAATVGLEPADPGQEPTGPGAFPSCYETYEVDIANVDADDAEAVTEVSFDLADCIHGRAIGRISSIAQGVLINFPDRDVDDVLGKTSLDVQRSLRALSQTCVQLVTVSGLVDASLIDAEAALCEAEQTSRLVVLIDGAVGEIE